MAHIYQGDRSPHVGSASNSLAWACVAFCAMVAIRTTAAAAPLPVRAGSTTFQFLAPFPPSPSQTIPIVHGDVNGDGRIDFLFAHNGFIGVRLGDGSGGFGPAILSAIS